MNGRGASITPSPFHESGLDSISLHSPPIQTCFCNCLLYLNDIMDILTLWLCMCGVCTIILYICSVVEPCDFLSTLRGIYGGPHSADCTETFVQYSVLDCVYCCFCALLNCGHNNIFLLFVLILSPLLGICCSLY